MRAGEITDDIRTASILAELDTERSHSRTARLVLGGYGAGHHAFQQTVQSLYKSAEVAIVGRMQSRLLALATKTTDCIAPAVEATPKRRRGHFYRKTAKWLDDAFFRLSSSCDVLLECGAHEASASIEFARRGRSAIAIEANPYTYRDKTKAAESWGVKTVNCGVADRRGELKFLEPVNDPQSGVSSFLRKPGEQVRGISVNATTVDFLAGDYCPTGKIALWIDVEGMAYQVISGAHETLKRCGVLKVEVEERQFWSDQKLAHDVDRILEEHGFVPVLRDSEYDHQYNIVYLPQNAVSSAASIISQEWRALAELRISWDEIAKTRARKIAWSVKQAIAHGPAKPIVHWTAAKLGSSSSERELRKQGEAARQRRE